MSRAPSAGKTFRGVRSRNWVPRAPTIGTKKLIKLQVRLDPGAQPGHQDSETTAHRLSSLLPCRTETEKEMERRDRETNPSSPSKQLKAWESL